MSRYIDAELLDIIVDELNMNGYDISNTTLERGKIILSHIPTADVVEVVRCKDCEHYKSPHCYEWHDDDDFCSHAERRKDG